MQLPPLGSTSPQMSSLEAGMRRQLSNLANCLHRTHVRGLLEAGNPIGLSKYISLPAYSKPYGDAIQKMGYKNHSTASGNRRSGSNLSYSGDEISVKSIITANEK